MAITSRLALCDELPESLPGHCCGFGREAQSPRRVKHRGYPPKGLGVQRTIFDVMPCIVGDFSLIVRT
jgi:hypothetical protein